VTAQSTQTVDVLCRAYHYTPEWWLPVIFIAGLLLGVAFVALGAAQARARRIVNRERS